MLSKREKVLVAVLGSLLLHGFILLLFGLGMHFKLDAAAAVSEQPIRLEITHEEEPTPTPNMVPVPLSTPPKLFVDNKDSNEPPPPDATFESNSNSHAASDQPPTGSAPVPTQQGKKIPEFTFDTHLYTLGPQPGASATAAAQAQPQQEQPPPDQQQPPESQPTPPPQPKETTPPRPKADRAAPRPEPTAAPTPELAALRDEFAMLGPTPTPHPVPTSEDNLFDPTRREPLTEPPRPTPAVRRPPTRQPSQPSNPGYQPMAQKADMSGSISNKGPAAVAALGTPMGRYKKAITDAIGSRWYYYMSQHSDVASFGTVKVHFIIDRSGVARRTQVISNTGNSTLENVSLQAITDASIPPIPPEVAEIIQSNQMELDFSFSLVDF